MTDYFEKDLEVAEYFQTRMNTQINTIGIHATLPDFTDKTGTSASIPQIAFRIAQLSQVIGNIPNPAFGLAERYQVIGQILDSAIGIGEHYQVIGKILDPEGISPLSSIKVSSQEKRNRRYVAYLSDFTKSWNLKKSQFASFGKNFVWDKFKTTIHQLLQLKSENISFTLTDDCSIFFKAVVKENNLYLEVFFEEESEENVEAIANIYKDGKIVLAYGGSIENTFEKIHELLIKKTKTIVPTAIPDAISSTHFATAEF